LKFKSVETLNWPWQVIEKREKDTRIDNLDDLHCMLIEIYYQAYIQFGVEADKRKVILDNGFIADLSSMTYYLDGEEEEKNMHYKLKRCGSTG